MSSLFDVPQALVMILSLAASGAGEAVPPAHIGTRAAAADANPYRFTDETWLRALHSGAGGDELSQVQAGIFRTSGGRYYVPAEAERKRIAALKRDPEIAALVAYGSARLNAKAMAPALSHAPGASDLYIAHVLGAKTAISLIALVTEHPAEPLVARLPEFAAIAAEMAGDKASKVTAGALYRRLTKSFPAAAPAPHIDVAFPLIELRKLASRTDEPPAPWGLQSATPHEMALLDWTAQVSAAQP